MGLKLFPDPVPPRDPKACAVCKSTEGVVLCLIEKDRRVPLCKRHREAQVDLGKPKTPKKRGPRYRPGF